MFNRKSNSNPGERVVFQTRPRFLANLKSTILKLIITLLIFYFFRSIIALAISMQEYVVQMVQIPLIQATFYVLILIIILLILSIILDVVSWKRKKYQLTNQRVIVKKGLIRRKKSYIHYSKIQDIDVYQGIVDRIFSAGDIEIYGGHEHTNIRLEDVPNPREVEDIIDRVMVGEEVGFKPQRSKTPKKSIIEEYDQKFKR
ncbi:PH domain-containing protein [Methanobacterium sp.]|uniref:PH domain-containing protein n=1 Tax=Methanobacterium sp. TaxID=2164 RepID=UPI0025D349F5|nr:PH domain-containing protein [Methanobacterium sp.]MBI5458439.1 PH domain-containing protein [Methanobacterium sp.]MDY9923532.1 PH domain-containing protein [Methanobacterium sp.]